MFNFIFKSAEDVGGVVSNLLGVEGLGWWFIIVPIVFIIMNGLYIYAGVYSASRLEITGVRKIALVVALLLVLHALTTLLLVPLNKKEENRIKDANKRNMQELLERQGKI